MKSIFTKIASLLKLPSVPNPPTPAPLILTGVAMRGGLRPDMIAERIILRKEEAGLPTGALDNGDPNPDEVMIRIIVEEVVKALQQDAVIEIATAPGTISNGAGGNAGGPVVVTSSQTSIGRGYGLIK